MKEFKIVIRYGKYLHEYEAILYGKMPLPFGFHFWLKVEFIRSVLLDVARVVSIWTEMFDVPGCNLIDKTGTSKNF